MRTATAWAAAALLLSLGSIAPAVADDTKAEKPIAGPWIGTLDISGIKLRLVLRVEVTAEGALKATLDSPDQGAKGIPVDEIAIEENELRFTQKAIAASYSGKINEAGTEIAGTFTQAGNSLPLNLARMEKEPELNRPQTPKGPFPYPEHEVEFKSRQEGVTLAGTLTVPMSSSPAPAVLLISGSGGQDRNETIAGHAPFHVLADYLTRRGIAVLRVDDRGVGKSTGDLSTATSMDFVEDVLGGVDFLKTRPEVNASQVGLIGHSEGGLIAPLAATRSSDVAFIVMLAGTGVAGEEILIRQSDDILRVSGASESERTRQREALSTIIGILKSESDLASAKTLLDKLRDDTIAALPEEEKKNEAAVAAIKAAMSSDRLASAWLKAFISFDPRPTLAQVKCAVLALNGELDLQVAPDTNLVEIHKALVSGGNRDYTIRVLPKLNHLFQTSTTGSPGEYGQIEETFAPTALEVIGDWVAERTGL